MLSPHLDDAAFSVGAYLHERARDGTDVVVITPLANDPYSDGGAGAWDERCGFRSAADAAYARRAEDLRACTALGSVPVWLPFADDTYGRRQSDDEIWTEIVRAVADAELVLLPGYPLALPDHRLITRLVLERRNELPGRLAFYAEQPYAAAALVGQHKPHGPGAGRLAMAAAAVRFAARAVRRERPLPPVVAADGVVLDGIQWRRERTSRADHRAKRRAVLSYSSQLRPIGTAPMLAAALQEARQGGELIGWAQGGAQTTAFPDPALRTSEPVATSAGRGSRTST